MIAQSIFDVLDNNNTTFGTPSDHYLVAIATPFTASFSGSVLYDPEYLTDVNLTLKHVTPDELIAFSSSSYFCRWYGKLPIASYSNHIAYSVYNTDAENMKFTISSDELQIYLRAPAAGVSTHIEWGDGTCEEYTWPDDKEKLFSHTYASSTSWTIKIYEYDGHLDYFQADYAINNLTSITSMLQHMAMCIIKNQTSLTTIPMAVWNSELTSAQFTDNALTVACVNNILVQADTAGFSNRTLELANQTPAAAPSGGGATAFSNLFSKGWTVSTD